MFAPGCGSYFPGIYPFGAKETPPVQLVDSSSNNVQGFQVTAAARKPLDVLHRTRGALREFVLLAP